MIRQLAAGLGPALAWLAFPLVPAVLGRAYHDTLNFGPFKGGGPDPRDWNWSTWLLLTGPLIGYGFLAGATLRLPDEPGRRGIRSWLSRRSTWVAVGPWIGFLVLATHVVVGNGLERLLGGLPEGRGWPGLPSGWENTWWGEAVRRAGGVGLFGFLAYGWLLVALAALRRARRRGGCLRALRQGVATALAFVGSLFGSFWAITEAWRSYFFDSRVVPLLLAAATLALAGGCGPPLTYGEVRRRELFGAMLMAWLLGLALAWRWWSRPRGE